MRTLLVVLCVGLSTTAFAETDTARFCREFKAEAARAHDYDAVLLALSTRYGDTLDDGSSWSRVLKAMLQSAPSDHLTILRGVAVDEGAPFSCPELEFPAGKPRSAPLLHGPGAEAVSALAADERGLVFANCPRDCTLFRLEGDAPVKLAQVKDVRELLLSPTLALVWTGTQLLAVPRSGGEPRVVVEPAGSASGFTLDGDGVLFIAREREVQRVALVGGAPVTLVGAFNATPASEPAPAPAPAPPGAPHRFKDLSSLPAFPSPVMLTRAQRIGTRLVLTTMSGDTFIVRAPDAAPERLTSVPSQPLVLGEQLVLVSPAAGPVSLVDLSTKQVTPVGLTAGMVRVVSAGQLFTVDESAGWPGRQRILSWAPRAKAWRELASPVGAAWRIAADAKRVYWVDGWWRGLYAAPRAR